MIYVSGCEMSTDKTASHKISPRKGTRNRTQLQLTVLKLLSSRSYPYSIPQPTLPRTAYVHELGLAHGARLVRVNLLKELDGVVEDAPTSTADAPHLLCSRPESTNELVHR